MFKQISDRPWWRCITDLAELVRAWWRIDRIRVSPQDGRLLRLGPRCILIIRGEAFEVRGRIVGESETGSCVKYDCAGERGASQLCVTVGSRRWPLRICWVQGGEVEDLSPSEIQIFERKSM